MYAPVLRAHGVCYIRRNVAVYDRGRSEQVKLYYVMSPAGDFVCTGWHQSPSGTILRGAARVVVQAPPRRAVTASVTAGLRRGKDAPSQAPHARAKGGMVP